MRTIRLLTNLHRLVEPCARSSRLAVEVFSAVVFVLAYPKALGTKNCDCFCNLRRSDSLRILLLIFGLEITSIANA